MDVLTTNMDSELIPSQLSGDLLIFQGYAYNKYGKSKSTQNWRCSARSRHNCPATMVTTKNQPYADHRICNVHSHQPEPIRIDKKKSYNTMKHRGRTTKDKSSVIVTEAIFNASEDLQRILPKVTSMRRVVQRSRQKPSIPNDLTGKYYV